MIIRFYLCCIIFYDACLKVVENKINYSLGYINDINKKIVKSINDPL